MPSTKRHSKVLEDDCVTSTASAKPAATPTMVSLVSPSTPERPNKRVADTHPPVGYESPLKKLKKTMSQHKHMIIDTVDDLRNFINNNDTSQPAVRGSIRIRARLLWFQTETLSGMHLLRLYLGEQYAPEPLEQQQREYQQAQQEDPFQANQFLITLSLFEIAPDNPNLPASGSVIMFTPTKLKLYRNCCQVQAKLSSITTVVPP